MYLLASEVSASTTATGAVVGAAVTLTAAGLATAIRRDPASRFRQDYYKHRLLAARLSFYASVAASCIGFGILGLTAVMLAVGALKAAAFAGGTSVLAHGIGLLFDRSSRQNAELLEKAMDRAGGEALLSLEAESAEHARLLAGCVLDGDDQGAKAIAADLLLLLRSQARRALPTDDDGAA